MDEAQRIAQSLVKSVQNMTEDKIEQPTRHAIEMAKLAEIFKEKTEQIKKMDSKVIQTSATPMASASIHNSPRVHQHKNRANTPGIIPPNSRVITTDRTPDWYETPQDKR